MKGKANQPVALRVGQAQTHDDEDGQPLQRIVAERALELRDDERPEAAQPRTPWGFGVFNLGF
jgi:hypothetical protein